MTNVKQKQFTKKATPENLIEFCQRLIQTKSLSGLEQQVADVILQEMLALGYDQAWIDKYGNVIGKVKGSAVNTPAQTVLFDGHIDTVPVSDSAQWTQDPYAGSLVDGKVYGRGASDMKGAVAAMVYGAGVIAQSEQRPAGAIYVSGTVHEEMFEGIAFDNVLNETKPDVVVIGEASELRLNIGQRGRAELAVYSYGKSAHSSNPRAGINAITGMMEIIKNIEKIKLTQHPSLGQGILVVTDIISNPFPGASVVPNQCRITIDRRLLVGETENLVVEQLQDCITQAQAADKTISGSVEIVKGEADCYTGEKLAGVRFFPAWLIEEDNQVVQTARAALQSCGQQAKINTYSFCTNGSQSAGVRGINTIGYGPSRENQAHVVDEYIEIEQLTKAYEGYIALAKALAEG